MYRELYISVLAVNFRIQLNVYAINAYWHLSHIRVSEFYVYKDKIIETENTLAPKRHHITSPRALCAIVSPPGVRSRVEKLTSCTRKFNVGLLRKSRGFRYTPVRLHRFRSSHTPKVQSTKDSVPRWRNLLGTRRRSSRRNFGSSVSFPSRLFVPLPSSVSPPSLLFRTFWLRELSKSRDANLTCTTTNEARRKGFERLRA